VINQTADPSHSTSVAAAEWVGNDVHIDGLPQVGEDACYRAMDWLLAIEPALAKEVYFSTAHLLNLEVDLLFFDTTSTYFEVDEADEPVARDHRGRPVDADDPAATDAGGFRVFGKSKDHREDLPQVIVGMAVTREGIPVRCWSWPGNTADSALIRQVRDDLREWNLARIVWVADRGFTSAENRRYLQRGAGHYILGEKLRGGTPAADAALSRQGRYQKVRDNLEVKEVKLDKDVADDRFVVCYNPTEAERDTALRDKHVTALTEMINGSDTLSATKRAELRGVISTKPHLKRYLRTTPGGLLRIDAAAIKREANLDGKYLLRTSDPTLSTEDIALGYKQLLEVERGENSARSPAGLSPPRGPHPLPRPALLAGPATHPDRRDPHQPPLARPTTRTRPHPPGHLHRPSRHLPPPHRTHQQPDNDPHHARPAGPATDHRSDTRNHLTCTDTTA
jgi:hypothetical protein